MKTKTLAMLMSAVLSTAALGFGQISPQPAAPVQAAPVQAVPSPRVEVFAFTPVGEVGKFDWDGKAIQESLQSQVSSTGASLVMSTAVPSGPTDPVAAAKAAGCNLAVVGTFQINNGQIRANGHVIDVNTGNSVGGFEATGKQEDLFKVEDALGAELARLMPPKPNAPAGTANTPAANQTNAMQPVAGQVGGQTTSVNPAPATDQVLAQPTVTYLTPVQPYTPQVPATYYYPDSFAPSYYGYDDPYLYGYYGVGFVGGYYGGYYGGRGYGYYGHAYEGRGYGGYRGGSVGTVRAGGGVSVGHAVGGGGHGGGHR